MNNLNENLASMFNSASEIERVEFIDQTNFDVRDKYIVANIKFYGTIDVDEEGYNYEWAQFITGDLIQYFAEGLESRNFKRVVEMLDINEYFIQTLIDSDIEFDVYQFGRMGGWLSICEESEVLSPYFRYGPVQKLDFDYKTKSNMTDEEFDDLLFDYFDVETREDKEILFEQLEDFVNGREELINALHGLCDAISKYAKGGKYKEFLENEFNQSTKTV